MLTLFVLLIPRALAADNDGDRYSGLRDCDDTNAAIHPGATEVCDGKDNNCDRRIDEFERITYYRDTDHDGYGDAASTVQACRSARGRVTNADDCDDTTSAVSPAAAEVCGDGIDNDCNGFSAYCELSGDVAASTANARFVGEAERDFAAWDISGVGDVNGDGHGDVVVGAPQSERGGRDAGAAYLALGPFSGDLALGSAAAILVGEDATDYAGYSVGGLGDNDGDGLADFAVSAWGDDTNGSDAGALYVVTGNPSGVVDLSTSTAKLLGDSGEEFGLSFLAGGDWDDDGAPDVIAASPYADYGGITWNGVVYLLSGPQSGTLTASTSWESALVGENQYNVAGSTLASGDMNGDGVEDLLVGASSWDADGAGVGDGLAEFLVGATKEDTGARGAGMGYLWFGAAR